jgi:hypothetical protein
MCVILKDEHQEASLYNTILVTFEVFTVVMMDIHEDLDLLHVVLKCCLVGTNLCSYCFLVLWTSEGLFCVCINVVHIKEERRIISRNICWLTEQPT